MFRVHGHLKLVGLVKYTMAHIKVCSSLSISSVVTPGTIKVSAKSNARWANCPASRILATSSSVFGTIWVFHQPRTCLFQQQKTNVDTRGKNKKNTAFRMKTKKTWDEVVLKVSEVIFAKMVRWCCNNWCCFFCSVFCGAFEICWGVPFRMMRTTFVKRY